MQARKRKCAQRQQRQQIMTLLLEQKGQAQAQQQQQQHMQHQGFERECRTLLQPLPMVEIFCKPASRTLLLSPERLAAVELFKNSVTLKLSELMPELILRFLLLLRSHQNSGCARKKGGCSVKTCGK